MPESLDLTVWALWLPIAASTVAVFFASFLAHMVLPHHKSDWRGLPNEEAMLNLIRSGGVPPGQYMFPHCGDMSQLKEPDVKQRFEAGPWGTMRVLPAMWNMGRNLALTFLTYLLISVVVAYLASMALASAADGMRVFRFTATAGIAAHCLGFFGHSIWFAQPLRAFINDVLDTVAYGLIIGLCFMLLWPG